MGSEEEKMGFVGGGGGGLGSLRKKGVFSGKKRRLWGKLGFVRGTNGSCGGNWGL